MQYAFALMPFRHLSAFLKSLIWTLGNRILVYLQSYSVIMKKKRKWSVLNTYKGIIYYILQVGAHSKNWTWIDYESSQSEKWEIQHLVRFNICGKRETLLFNALIVLTLFPKNQYFLTGIAMMLPSAQSIILPLENSKYIYVPLFISCFWLSFCNYWQTCMLYIVEMNLEQMVEKYLTQ